MRRAAAFAGVLCLGCAGSIGHDDSPGGTTATPQVLPMGVRRLDREELNNTLHELIGDTSGAALALAPDSRGPSGFLEGGVISTNNVESLIEVVQGLGADLAARLPGLVACNPAASGEDACATQFLTSFGRRAYRRRLAPAEVANLVGRFHEVVTTLGYSFHEALRVVVQAMLLSPNFLYHWELGPGPATAQRQDGLVRLTPDESAARLSYFLWGSMPDDDLFAAVDAGRLATPADLEVQARRMLGHPGARARVASFHAQWLGLDAIAEVQKDAMRYPAFDENLLQAMTAETSLFVKQAVLDGDGLLRTLLTSRATFVNGPLAAIYGLPDIAGLEIGPATLDAGQRAGLFTRAAFLTVNAGMQFANPVRRGHVIYSDVLCGVLNPPPNDVPPLPSVRGPDVSNRAVIEAHDRNACAAGCHGLFDPLGFAFEHYDAIGRYQTMDAGKAVDSSGMLLAPSRGEPAPFGDAVDLMSLLAGSDDVRRCVIKHWFRFALRREEVADDEPALQAAYTAFARSDDNIRELLVALSRTRSFLYRTPAPGEILR